MFLAACFLTVCCHIRKFIDLPLAIRLSQAAPNKVQMEGTQEDGRKKDSNAIAMVEVEGSRYFVVDQDLRKGDRRGDGQIMAEFFTVGNGERLKKPRLLYDPSHGCIRQNSKVRKGEEALNLLNVLTGDAAMRNDEDGFIRLEEGRLSSQIVNLNGNIEGINENRGITNASTSGVLEQEEDKDVEVESNVPPRLPDKGIRCAVRKRTSRLLWLHEFFRVYESARSKNKFPWVYEALQFKVGGQLPEGVVEEMSDRLRQEIWVLGVCYVPAIYVRKFSKRERGYMFHTELNDDDADKALYGHCPEIVRVENCLKWHPMSTVSIDVPRIVHADDVKNRRVHVAGRGMHFVCGTSAVEDVHCQEFRLSRLHRRHFFMYPEERSGPELNSASFMWEHIDSLFAQIRQCMRTARLGSSSASFHMPFVVSSYEFWKVCTISGFGSVTFHSILFRPNCCRNL